MAEKINPKVEVLKVTIVLPVGDGCTAEDIEALKIVIAARAVQPPPGADPNTPIGFVSGAYLDKMPVKDMPAPFIQAALTGGARRE